MNNKTAVGQLQVRAGQLYYLKVRFLIVATVFAVSLYSTLLATVDVWLTRDNYTHGFLIPVISAYFVWVEKDRLLQTISIMPNLVGGVILILLGSFMLVVGNVSTIITIEIVSLLPILAGIVLTICGIQYLKALALPVTYLIFMTPALDIVTEKLHWPFQLFAAYSSAFLLNSIGIPVFRSVNFLELPNITLEVAQVCSGAGYLISMMAIAIPLSYFTCDSWPKRTVLLLFAALVAPLMNLLRITIIGIWVYNSGEVHGPFQLFQALSVAIIGYVLILFLAAFLSKKSGKLPGEKTALAVGQKSSLPLFACSSAKVNWAVIFTVAILTSTGIFIHIHSIEPVPLSKPLQGFPLTVGDWNGVEATSYKKLFGTHDADSEITRVYTNSLGEKLLFHIAYFESQRQGQELIHEGVNKHHSGAQAYRLVPDGSGRPIHVNKNIEEHDRIKYALLFFYQMNGQVYTDKYWSKLVMIVDNLLYNRSNGAMVIVAAKIYKGDKTKALYNAKEFVEKSYSLINQYIP